MRRLEDKLAKSWTRESRPSGFTLIELMITVGVLGILASVALPSYRQYVYRAREAEVYSIVGGIEQAAKAYWQVHWTSRGLNGSEYTYCTATHPVHWVLGL